LVLDPEAEFAGATASAVLTRVLAQVSAPQHRAEAPVPVGAATSAGAGASEDAVARGGSTATGA
jgi:MoxR-like ATPase